MVFFSSASPRTNTSHYHRRSPIADRQKKVMARTKQTRSLSMRTTGQFGGKQPRTNPAPPPPPPPPQKLHECLAIIEQKTEPHYKAVACIDNKNIRVPEKELCKSVEATIDRVIQSCWTDHFISDSDVYFTVVILCNWHVRADRADDRQERFKKAAITILQYTNHHNFTVEPYFCAGFWPIIF